MGTAGGAPRGSACRSRGYARAARRSQQLGRGVSQITCTGRGDTACTSASHSGPPRSSAVNGATRTSSSRTWSPASAPAPRSGPGGRPLGAAARSSARTPGRIRDHGAEQRVGGSVEVEQRRPARVSQRPTQRRLARAGRPGDHPGGHVARYDSCQSAGSSRAASAAEGGLAQPRPCSRSTSIRRSSRSPPW